MRKLWFFGIVVVPVIFSSCFSSEKPKEPKTKHEIPIIQLTSQDTFLEKKYVASIEAIRNVELRNKVSGYLEKIFVDEGQSVKKGQLLFAIDPSEFSAEVSKEEAVLNNAMAEAKEADVQLERVNLLVKKNVISPSELEVALARQKAQQAKINEARSLLSNAKTRLSYTYIRAPFDGIINRIPFKTGSLLTEGSLLTTVSDISSVYAYFNIAEDEYLRYLKNKPQQENNNKIHLNLADGSQYPYTGEVETMTSEFEEGTGSIAFRARFPNPHKLLRHGATGEVILNTKVENALMVPQKSVFEIQDRYYVFVVDKNNTIKMKSFLPKTRIAEFYIVQSGLQPGERIAYEGTQNLKEGMEIQPKPMDVNKLIQDDQDKESSLAQAQQ